MQKRAGLILLILFLSVPSFSQDSIHPGKVYGGILVSPDYCWAKVSNVNNSNYSLNQGLTGKIAFTAGINLVYQINSRFSVNLGLEYSEKDVANRNTIIGYGDLWHKYNVNYLDIPLEFNCYFIKKKRHAIYFLAGVSENMFLFATQSDTWIEHNATIALYTPEPVGPYGKAMIYSGVNPFNTQLHLGLGSDFTLRKARLRMEFVFRSGLSPANETVAWKNYPASDPFDYARYLLLNCSRTYYSCGLAFSYLWGG
jgi:hypothetical protein